ncbi:hypothetical protein ACHAQH_001856 [Verticillium albo-atrum]
MVSGSSVLAVGAYTSLAVVADTLPDCDACVASCGIPTVTETVYGCCPAPSTATVTVTETVVGCCQPPEHSTINIISTVYVTDIVSDIYTQVVPTTEWETQIATETISYAVTVTEAVCTGPPQSGYPPIETYPAEPYPVPSEGEPSAAPTYGVRRIRAPPPELPDCVYYTTTIWETTTQESTQTIHVSNISTLTVHQPTTYYETEIVVSGSVSTYVSTYTYISVLPTTVVSDRTEYVTETYISVSTFTEEVDVTDYQTITNTATAIETATATATQTLVETEVVTLTGEVTTIAGEVTTLPGEVTTLPGEVTTLPGEVTTLPGETITTTITETGPETTVTVTEDGEVIISVVPGPTSVITTTVVLPPVTVTVRPPVTACPAPTNIPGVNPDMPFDPSSNRTWGCEPGFVCNPPKPEGCNLWADSPANDYVCKPKYCVPSPHYALATWPEGETSYYPPSEGYFNLNPNAFGLPFSIFDYETIVKEWKHKTWTITTGNWASATELSVYPPRSPTTTPVAPPPVYETYAHGYVRRQNDDDEAEDGTTAPAICFDDCNNCYIEAEAVGKTPRLCAADSQFRADLLTCTTCIDANAVNGVLTRRLYVTPKFAQFLDYCDSQEPDEVTTSSVASLPPQESAVVSSSGSDDDVTTTSAAPVNPSTSARPISSPSTSEEASSTSEPETSDEPTATESASLGEPQTTSSAEASEIAESDAASGGSATATATSDGAGASESIAAAVSSAAEESVASQTSGAPGVSQTEEASPSSTGGGGEGDDTDGDGQPDTNASASGSGAVGPSAGASGDESDVPSTASGPVTVPTNTDGEPITVPTAAAGRVGGSMFAVAAPLVVMMLV